MGAAILLHRDVPGGIGDALRQVSLYRSEQSPRTLSMREAITPVLLMATAVFVQPSPTLTTAPRPAAEPFGFSTVVVRSLLHCSLVEYPNSTSAADRPS